MSKVNLPLPKQSARAKPPLKLAVPPKSPQMDGMMALLKAFLKAPQPQK